MGVSIQIIRKKIKKEKIFIFFMCVVFEQYYLPREVKLLLTFNDFNQSIIPCVSIKVSQYAYHIFYEQENTIIQSVWANIKIFYI